MNSVPTTPRPCKAKPYFAGSKNPNWKGGKITKQCTFCNAAFEVIPSRAHARYCSLVCCNKSPERRAIIRKRRAPLVSQQCPICNTTFEITSGLIGRKKFCSHECQFKWRRVKFSGEGNPSWKGGTSQGDYPYDWPRISKRIMERDGHQCWNPACLKTDERLVVHHIDFDKMNVSDENLVTVCGSCNSRANYHRTFWTQFLSSFNKWRFESGLLVPIFTGTIELNLGKARRGE